MDTVRWFGDRRWDAPICDLPPVEVPVGASCCRCRGLILAGDQGLVVPVVGSADECSVYHRVCFLAELGIAS